METIKKGSRGSDVKKLQELLGLTTCDGIFGAGTEAALVAWQATHRDSNGNPLTADGVCGQKTWEALMATAHDASATGSATLTIQQLGKIMPNAISSERAARYLGPLNDVMAKYNITTPLRMAHFLAQIAHESGELRYAEEIASGSAYEGRKDLGNTQRGDGQRYKGRGLIQLTGRANYAAFAKDTGCDCINHPEILAQLPWSVETAGWFWHRNKLNDVADTDAFITVTRRINGGTNGKESRQKYLMRAKQVLKE